MSRGTEFARTVTRVATAAAVFLGAEVLSNPTVVPFIGRTADQIRGAVEALKAGDFSIINMPIVFAAAGGSAGTPNPERTVSNFEAQVSSNPLDIVYPNGDNRQVRHSMTIDNLRQGNNPPNDEDRRVGTIDDIDRDTNQIINQIQINTTLIERVKNGTGGSVVTTGQLVDTSNGRVYLALEVVENNVHFVALGFIPDINNPNDYLSHQIHELNISGTFGDAVKSFSLDQDNQGKYVKIEKKRSLDSKDDGEWIKRLDSSGIPVGEWTKVSVVENPLKYRRYAPLTNNPATKPN